MVIEALDDLAARGVNSCQPGALDVMRQAVFTAMPIKEVSIVGPDGHMLCTHLGLPPVERTISASTPLRGADGCTVDIVQFPDARRMLRLRRNAPDGPNAIAALMPPAMLLPQLSIEGSPFSAYAYVATLDGTVLAASSQHPDDAAAIFKATAKSDKFGIETAIAAPRALLPAA